MSVARKKRRESNVDPVSAAARGARAAAGKSRPEFGWGRKIASYTLAGGIGVFFAALALTGRLVPPAKTKSDSIIVGTHDIIHYLPPATADIARALGEALKSVGFFQDRGADVTLSRGVKGPLISFVVKDGAWNDHAALLSFEAIGNRISEPLGGLPVKIRLTDAQRKMHREIVVGRIMPEGKDQLYYCGSATEAEAATLGRALVADGAFTGQGAIVWLSREDVTTLSFVVNESGLQPQVIGGLQNVVRQVAPSLGGLPITLRLLDASLATKFKALVQ